MEIAEIIRLTLLAQESINAITPVPEQRQRITRLIQKANVEGFTLTAESLAVDLADLHADPEPEPE